MKVLHILSYGGSSEVLKNLENFLEKFELLEMVEVKVRGNGKILQTKSDLINDDDASKSFFIQLQDSSAVNI